MKRVLTAALLLPPVVYIILAGHWLIFLAAVSLISLVCYYEFTRMACAHGVDADGPVGYAAAIVILAVPRLDFALAAAAAILGLAVSLRARDLSRVLPRAAVFVLGLAYTVAPWRCAVALRGSGDDGPHWLLYALSLAWVGDIAAYYVGSLFGRHKMTPRISPGKSWEGAFAGLAASVAFGVAYLGWFVPDAPLTEVVPLTLVAGIAGQFGDLCESALKRGAGIKDSGSLLPGHGGWLDRLDACLFTMPVVYFWLSRGSMVN